jgi:uncharacterized protein (TIGR02118 family)
MAVVRVCYKSGARFDVDYYVSSHLALATRIMEPLGLRSMELVRVSANPDGTMPAYQAVFSGYFDSVEEIHRAMAGRGMEELLADIPNYYDGSAPDIFVGEVVPLPALR